MGGAISTKGADVMTVSEDGEIGLTEQFTAYFKDQVPAPFNLDAPMVTRAHEALIKDNWANIVKGTSAFNEAKHVTPTKFMYNSFYQALFVTSQPLRALFRSGMTAQGKSLAGTLNTLVTIINGGDFVDTVQAIAERHLTYGVTKDHYTDFGVILLSSLEAVSGDKWSDDVKDAYLNAYSLCYYMMMPIIAGDAPVEIPESIPATIVKSVPISKTGKKITLKYNFPLRYYPGDAIWLGLPLPKGEVRRHFCITGFPVDGVFELDVVIEDVSESSHWFCSQSPGATVNLFWIESDLRFETDAPAALPQHVVFVSNGFACIPFITMAEGLSRIKDKWKGTVVSLQIAPTADYVDAFNIAVPTAGKKIEWDAYKAFHATEVTAAKLKQIAPNIANATL
ncbi:hypothetical protein As57867_023327, partial [Aphanomyces stellatus]